MNQSKNFISRFFMTESQSSQEMKSLVENMKLIFTELTDQVFEKSISLFDKFKQSTLLGSVHEQRKDKEKLILLGSIYINSQGSIDLNEIIEKTETKLIDFFEILNSMLICLDLEIEGLKSIEKVVIVIGIIYEIYNREFIKIFKEETRIFSIGWYKFLNFNEIYPDILLDLYYSLKLIYLTLNYLYQEYPNERKQEFTNDFIKIEKEFESEFNKYIKDDIKEEFKYKDLNLLLLNSSTIGNIDKFYSGPIYLKSLSENKMTFIEMTLNLIDLINQNLKDVTITPSQDLLRFLKGDLNEKVQKRLENFIEKIQFHAYNKEYLQNLFKKTYYQVLLKILLGEEQRVNQNDFTTLLLNDNFNKSLILSSIETVLFSYNIRNRMDFIEMMNLFQLEPFDYLKTIESFVLYSNWFDSILKRHFKQIEEKLFDSLTWREGSILYEIIRSESLSLKFFLKKISLFIEQRVKNLISFFTFDSSKDICEIVNYIIKNKSHLMINRNIDQIILCCIYANFKVNKIDILFRDIIYNYRCYCENNRQLSPSDSLKTLWFVPLDSKKNTGDIVKFYNQIFLNETKEFILKDHSNQQQSVQSSPRTKISDNVYMSPIKKMPSTPMTPKTNKLYAFGEGFTTPKRTIQFDSEEKDDFVKRKLKKLNE